MASTSAVSMALPLTRATQSRFSVSEAFFKPSRAIATTRSNGRLEVKAAYSVKEKVVPGLTAAAIIGAIIGVSNFDPVKRA